MNYIAFDYLVYPTEVFVNLRQSFNLPAIAGASALGGALLCALTLRAVRNAAFPLPPPRCRRRSAVGATLAAMLCWPAIGLIPAPSLPSRATAEIARNDLVTLAVSALTFSSAAILGIGIGASAKVKEASLTSAAERP